MSLKETINQKFIEEFKTRIAIRRYPYEVMKQRIMIAEKSGQYTLPLTDEQIMNLIAKECKEREELLSIYKPEDNENNGNDDLSSIASFLRNNLKSKLQKQIEE